MKYKLVWAFLMICTVFCSCTESSESSINESINNSNDTVITDETIATTDSKESGTERETYNQNKIIELKTPAIFARYDFSNDYPNFHGKTLLLELTDGVYDAERSNYESSWSGNFQFRITSSNNYNYEVLTDDIISCKMFLGFNNQFDLNINDYNNDGAPDFAINQWNSLSGGTDCYLFTILQTGIVSNINVDVNGELKSTLWLPKSYRSVYSPNFETGKDNTFIISYFTAGGVSEKETPLISSDTIDAWFSDIKHQNSETSEFTLKNIYKWNNEVVILKEQQILEPNGDVWINQMH